MLSPHYFFVKQYVGEQIIKKASSNRVGWARQFCFSAQLGNWPTSIWARRIGYRATEVVARASKLLHLGVLKEETNARLRLTGRRALAVLGCLALLYFAAGAALHHHSGGADTACHICQTLHMPALAAAALNLIPEAQQVAARTALPFDAAPQEPFALHRASRAPPSA